MEIVEASDSEERVGWKRVREAEVKRTAFFG